MKDNFDYRDFIFCAIFIVEIFLFCITGQRKYEGKIVDNWIEGEHLMEDHTIAIKIKLPLTHK